MENKLKELRIRRHYSQQQMAEMIGIKTSRYGSWERGERMLNAAQLVQCARVLDCSTDEILGLPINQSFSDPREAELHRVWQGLDRERQDRLLATAHDMETAKSNGGVSDWIEEVAE